MQIEEKKMRQKDFEAKEETMELEWLYKVDSECELNSWSDSSVS